MTSEQQLPTSEQNIADGGIYDEIEDVFKLLESPCEKGDTRSSSTAAAAAVSGASSHFHASICKSNWLKQSTFTINGTQAIFYLKLLHDSPCDLDKQSTVDASPHDSSATLSEEVTTASATASIDLQR